MNSRGSHEIDISYKDKITGHNGNPVMPNEILRFNISVVIMIGYEYNYFLDPFNLMCLLSNKAWADFATSTWW